MFRVRKAFDKIVPAFSDGATAGAKFNLNLHRTLANPARGRFNPRA